MTDKRIKSFLEDRLKRLESIRNEREWTTAELGDIACCKQTLAFIDSMQEEPVSEELEEAAKEYSGKSSHPLNNAFKAGTKWQAEQFEKNRLKHCNSITNEQAELEQGFIDQHLDKHQRMPTFLDAIEYGMEKMKEQMMAKAIDGEVGYLKLHGLSVNVELPHSVEEGDKVKIIVIREDV